MDVTISTSDIRDFKKCRFRWNITSPLRGNWKSNRPDKNLIAGDYGHQALSEYYAPRGDNDAVGRAMTVFDYNAKCIDMALRRQWIFNEVYDSIMEELTITREALSYYCNEWAPVWDKFEKVIDTEIEGRVHLGFQDCLGRDVWFVFKVDGLVKFQGRYWLLEHKTCSKFPQFDSLIDDEQYRGYLWAARHDAFLRQFKPVGTIYTFLRKQVPKPPNVLVRGGLSKDKRQVNSTTYALYMRALQQQGLDPNEYRDILEALQEAQNPTTGSNAFVQRLYLPEEPKTLEVFGERVKAIAREMIRPDVLVYTACDWHNRTTCDMQIPCHLAWRGLDYMSYIKQRFTQRPARYHFAEAAEVAEEESDYVNTD